MRLFVKIEKTEGSYSGAVHGLASRSCPLVDLKLGPDARLQIKGKERSLEELWLLLVDSDRSELAKSFDYRGQQQLGTHLFNQIFRSNAISQRDRQTLLDSEAVEVRIVTPEEHILRLPWNLLCDEDGLFLAMQGWSMTLARTRKSTSVDLPTQPRLLIVAPNPRGLPPTRAEQHLNRIRQLLEVGGSRDYWRKCCATVRTWSDFKSQLEKLDPHLVYYYGHGTGDHDSSELIFEDERAKGVEKVSMVRLGQCLRDQEAPPRLVYLNSCSGDAGGLLGAGNQLRKFVPAVIANRTAAWAKASQSLALEFLEGLLLDGMEPHTAIARTHERLYDLPELEKEDLQWMTPVLHASYDHWHCKALRREPNPATEPYGKRRFDRTDQIGEITQLVGAMLETRQPTSYAFVWHGGEGQGVDLFHDHLVMELSKLPEVEHLHAFKPDWPAELCDLWQSFEDMLKELFWATELSDVPNNLRTEKYASPRRGQTSVFYLRLPPVVVPSSPASLPMNLKTVGSFLRFWESHVSRYFEPPCFAILGIALRIDRAQPLEQELTRLEMTTQDRFRVKRLKDELANVTVAEIENGLQIRHSDVILPVRRPKVAREIYSRTQGHYRRTLDDLDRAVEIDWQLDAGATKEA